MRLEDYPPQEPLSEFGREYQSECFRLSQGIQGHEHFYAEDHACQSLMMYPAKRPNGACLIFLFGGGWTNGYKEQVGFVAPALNDAGISVASVGYRLAPEYTFPSNLDDIKRAVKWVFDNADEYQIDQSRLFLGGHSAGAHLTSLLGVTQKWRKEMGLPNSVIAGCLPISGTYDFTPGNGLSMRPRFLGPIEEGNEVAASPLFNMEDCSTPFLVSFGSDDFPHLIPQAEKFIMVREKIAPMVDRLLLKGLDHMTVFTIGAAAGGAWSNRAIDFINQ